METIISISGKPGLYRLISRNKMNFIVEILDETHRRMPVFATDRVTSLSDVAMYTDADDVALWKVLASIGKKEEGKVAQIDIKKSSSEELSAYFAEVLPEYDRDRVHLSDIKKLLQWYNILVKAGITDFEDAFSMEKGEETDAAAE